MAASKLARRPLLQRVAVAVFLSLSVLGAMVAEADAAGGKPCTLNVECGIPAANLQQLRADAASITGSCVNGACVCSGAYGCSGCYVNGATLQTPLSAPFSPKIDVCANPFGGGRCEADSQCFNGLCIHGKCVCYSGWTCEYCTLAVTADVLNHATCGAYSTGGRSCTTDATCDHGQCILNKCQCSSGFVCDDCSVSQSHVLGNVDQCTCQANQCNGHGTCSNGECTCDASWTGAYCTVDLCEGVSCSGHGTCSAGNCTCTGGYSGPKCDSGGGGCTSNADCGVWAPIDGSSAQCDNWRPCVEGKYGGTCVAGQCQCNTGYTCSTCTAKGFEECSEATGGKACATSADCGPRDDGTNGGMCVEGRCICFPGFVCPECNVVGPLVAGQVCPVINIWHTRGEAPCAASTDCGPIAGGGSGGACVEGKCECYQGYACPTCNYIGEPDFAAGENCTLPTGGGQCNTNDECVNGVCSAGVCRCVAGYDCPYCNARALVVGSRIPGKCETDRDCGTDIVQGGACTDGECICYTGFKCSMCDKHGLAECPPEDIVQPGAKLVCPDPPPKTGGAECEDLDDCGPLADGAYGGQCSNGKCLCWSGYTCPNCERTKAEIDSGLKCAGANLAASWLLFAGAVAVATLLGNES